MAIKKRKIEEATPEPVIEGTGSAAPSPNGRMADWTNEEVKELCTLRRSGMTWE